MIQSVYYYIHKYTDRGIHVHKGKKSDLHAIYNAIKVIGGNVYPLYLVQRLLTAGREG